MWKPNDGRRVCGFGRFIPKIRSAWCVQRLWEGGSPLFFWNHRLNRCTSVWPLNRCSLSYTSSGVSFLPNLRAASGRQPSFLERTGELRCLFVWPLHPHPPKSGPEAVDGGLPLPRGNPLLLPKPNDGQCVCDLAAPPLESGFRLGLSHSGVDSPLFCVTRFCPRGSILIRISILA